MSNRMHRNDSKPYGKKSLMFHSKVNLCALTSFWTMSSLQISMHLYGIVWGDELNLLNESASDCVIYIL